MTRYERELHQLAAEHGRRLEQTGGGHVRLVRPGSMPIFAAATPSCWRALRNLVAMLRRADRQAAASGND